MYDTDEDDVEGGGGGKGGCWRCWRGAFEVAVWLRGVVWRVGVHCACHGVCV